MNVVALFFDVLEEFAKGGVVFIDDEMGFRDDGGAVLKIDEAVRTLEVKVDFLRIEEVEDGDIVLSKAEVLEGVSEFVGVNEEV